MREFEYNVVSILSRVLRWGRLKYYGLDVY